MEESGCQLSKHKEIFFNQMMKCSKIVVMAAYIYEYAKPTELYIILNGKLHGMQMTS